MRHENRQDERPAHGLAFHANRGVRELAHLKAGWRWLTDDEAERYLELGVVPTTTPLVKPRLMKRDLVPGATWRRFR